MKAEANEHAITMCHQLRRAMGEVIAQAEMGEAQDLPAADSTPEVVQEVERRSGRLNSEPTREADMLPWQKCRRPTRRTTSQA
jgi:hypothetical protein